MGYLHRFLIFFYPTVGLRIHPLHGPSPGPSGYPPPRILKSHGSAHGRVIPCSPTETGFRAPSPGLRLARRNKVPGYDQLKSVTSKGVMVSHWPGYTFLEIMVMEYHSMIHEQIFFVYFINAYNPSVMAGYFTILSSFHAVRRPLIPSTSQQEQKKKHQKNIVIHFLFLLMHNFVLHKVVPE